MAVTQMAQSESDTTEPEPVRLRHREKGESGYGRYYLMLTGLAQQAGLTDYDYADVRADLEDPREPMLIVGGLSNEMDIDPDTDPHARKVIQREAKAESSVEVSIPHSALDERGLGLDLSRYSDTPELLFSPILDPSGIIGLIPAEFSDGTPYIPPALRREVLELEEGEEEEEEEDEGEDSYLYAYEAGQQYLREQEAAEAEPETGSTTLIDYERVEQMAGMYGADPRTVADAIQALAGHEDLADAADTTDDDYPPLDAPDGERRIYFVPTDAWRELVADLDDVDKQTRSALRAIEVQAAEDVLAATDAVDAYHGFDQTHVPVVAAQSA